MKLIRSFGYAMNGLKTAWLEQPNLCIHSLVIVVVAGLGFYSKLDAWEWCMVILASAGVVSLELMNTAVESLTDLVTKEKNPLAAKIKDISAAAVLVAALASFVVGLLIFGRHLAKF